MGHPDLSLDCAEDPAGQVEDGGDEVEDSADYDADQAERQQDKPDEWVEDDGDQGEGPADDEKDEEEDQFEHFVTPEHLYGNAEPAVPRFYVPTSAKARRWGTRRFGHGGAVGGGGLVGG